MKLRGDWIEQTASKIVFPPPGQRRNIKLAIMEALQEAEERGRRLVNDELLEMVKELIEDHNRICKYAHRRRGCKTPKKAQALIERIENGKP